MVDDKIIDDLVQLVEKQKKENKYSYNPEITEGQIRAYITTFWDELESQVQQNYQEELAIDGANVKKFARDLSRSLNGTQKHSLTQVENNFRDIELPNHSKQNFIFVEKEFGDILAKLNPTMKKLPAFVGNIQTQLAGVPANLQGKEKQDLLTATANLIAGITTNKSSYTHARSIDNAIVNQFGQIKNAKLVRAIANYANQNLDQLSKLDTKTQKFIAGVLKDNYNALPANSTIAEINIAFSKVNIAAQAQIKAEMQANRSIVRKLTNLFKSRNRIDSDGSISTKDTTKTRSLSSGNVRAV